jgi:hypothetical protein
VCQGEGRADSCLIPVQVAQSGHTNVRSCNEDTSSEMETNGDLNMTIFSRETTGPEQVGDKVEGEIREFVRRDGAGPAAVPGG